MEIHEHTLNHTIFPSETRFYCYMGRETPKATPNKVTLFSWGDFVWCFGRAEWPSFLVCGSFFRCYYSSKPNSQIAAKGFSK